MWVPENVFSEEEMAAYYEDVLKHLAEDKAPLANGLTSDCPDRGESEYYTLERGNQHLETCAVCQERRRIHQRAVKKLMN
jgi:hypothetical protein